MAYLKVDVIRLDFAEVWRWGNPATFAVFAMRKLLGWRMYGPVLIPDAPGIVKLSADEVRDDLRAALRSTVKEVAACDFEPLFHYRVATQGPSEGIAVAFLHSSRRAVCLMVHASSGATRKVATSLVTRVEAGRFVATGSGGTTFNSPPEVDAVRLPGQAPAAIVAAHLKRIDGRRSLIVEASEVENLILDLQRLTLEYNIRRGVYVPAIEPGAPRANGDSRGGRVG